MTEKRIKKLKRKLQKIRYGLAIRFPEFAAPLFDMLYVAADDICRMSTNGFCIFFNADWFERLPERSAEYSLCHQLMHIKSGHLSRQGLYKGDRFHLACNIIVNSKLVAYGFYEEKLPGIGTLRRKTFYPETEGENLTPYEAFKMTPFDPAVLNDSQRRNILFDSDEMWDFPDIRGEKGVLILSPEDTDPEDLRLPDRIALRTEKAGKEFRQYMPEVCKPETEISSFDDGSFEYDADFSSTLKETVAEIRKSKNRDGEIYGDSGFYERILNDGNRAAANDWRSLLNRFIMNETKDYDFSVPDRRFFETEFFIPDFGDFETPSLNVLFMVDVSASLREREVSSAVFEIRSAIAQFSGMLKGYIGFFDSSVLRVAPISEAETFLKTTPYNGGGTDFNCIFSYVRKEMSENPPSEIVIITDGKGDFPDYGETLNIPVLWLLSEKNVRVPWGKSAYMKGDI